MLYYILYVLRFSNCPSSPLFIRLYEGKFIYLPVFLFFNCIAPMEMLSLLWVHIALHTKDKQWYSHYSAVSILYGHLPKELFD